MEKKEKGISYEYPFVRKVIITVLISLAILLFVVFIGQAVNTLLVIFAGVLLGIIFRVGRDFIHQKLKLKKWIALTLVVLSFLSIFAGGGYLLGPRIAQQANMFYQEIPETWQKTKEFISQWSWGRELANENPQFKDFFENETNGTGEDYDMTKSILNYLSFTAAVAAGLILIFVIAVYIAAEPKLYTEGALRLFPKRHRSEVLSLMNEMSRTIQWWLVGQLVSMTILGILSVLGLWLLGVPYALLLGLFTAFTNFIPNLGPIIAAIPALGVALTQGLDTAIYVALFFTALQCVEGYFITPMIYRRAISVPPVLIITVQFLLYYMIGFLGILLAMPLMGCMMILVQRLYVEDVLGDSMNEEIHYNLEGENIFNEEERKKKT